MKLQMCINAYYIVPIQFLYLPMLVLPTLSADQIRHQNALRYHLAFTVL